MVFKSDRSMINSNNQSPDRLNRIVEGTHIEGDIKSDSNIRIDGYLKGTIIVKGRLVLGPTGKIDGSINCKKCNNKSRVEGSCCKK